MCALIVFKSKSKVRTDGLLEPKEAILLDLVTIAPTKSLHKSVEVFIRAKTRQSSEYLLVVCVLNRTRTDGLEVANEPPPAS